MNILKKILVVVCVVFVLAAGAFGFWASDKYVVPVLMYHHVAPDGQGRSDTVSPEVFQKHLEYLRDKKFDVLSMDEFIELKQNNQKFSRKSVVITFDDGYIDNYTYAYPKLKQYGFSAIFYLPPAFMEENAPEHMNWDQVKEMAQGGMEIGSHSYMHTYLPDLSEEELKIEIYKSKKFLEDLLDAPIRHFSYPVGGFSELIKEKVKEAGYISAVATNRGYDKLNKDLYEINRVRLSDDDVRAIDMWAKFSGYYNLFRKTKSPN